MRKPRVLLVGWDAADWKVIQPLLDAGQMPNLAKLIANGVRGNIATLYPALSPMLWTSIATGKRPHKHGIHGFSEPMPDGAGVRPITLLARKTKAVWNILNQNGHRSIVVGWWPSHPAEPLNGAMVSNLFPHATGQPGHSVLPTGAIHPASLTASLAGLRVNPMELGGEFLRMFVPEYEKVDQHNDKRLHSLAKIIAETMSVHAAGTELLATQPWDFAAVYYSGIDHFGHAFMSYHPPRLPHVTDWDFEIYQHVIANAYRYHDAMLGTLLGFTDENTTVILMSDHGFHPDHLRPGYIPAEPAGPAVEHRHFGILCLKGPDLRVNEQLFSASLLDICPTILTLFGLPPGKDMDGKVLLTAFKESPSVNPIESWDNVPGEAGTHSPETQLDPVASAEAFKQLVELGYVAPPGPNVQETIAECVRELKYNLARSYRDGHCCAEAAALAEEIWTRWPSEHRFGMLLIDSLEPLGETVRRQAAIEELGRRIEKYQVEARTELARRAEEKKREPGDAAKDHEGLRRAQFEERRLRELAHGRPVLLDWLRVSQALLENRASEARALLEKLKAEDASGTGMKQRLADALSELGDWDTAQRLLETTLEDDPENPAVHSQLADIHFKAKRFDQAITSATESLSLVYFQPGLHALLGRALLEVDRVAEAEQELQVAVAQSPRNLVAHESLANLYRHRLNRPAEAFAHEGRARSLRNELTERQRLRTEVHTREGKTPVSITLASDRNANPPQVPQAFDASVDPSKIIVVVSGLPRSGTSLMMQLLVAAGRKPLTDGKRIPDEDNPLGYFEFERTLTLANDTSWIPEARGKVVKIVAQLLPHLPRNEHYHVIFMDRSLSEVIASQKAMLTRQGRRGAELDERKLAETYRAQLERVHRQIARRTEMRTLSVNYSELLADPAASATLLARFLGEPFDCAGSVAAVRPELRRHKLS